MLAVTSPRFVVFAALLVGLWYPCPPARRWQLMLAASVLFYLSLDWQGFVVLLLCALLVWWCALRARKGGWFGIGLAAALAPLVLLKYYLAAAGGLRRFGGCVCGSRRYCSRWGSGILPCSSSVTWSMSAARPSRQNAALPNCSALPAFSCPSPRAVCALRGADAAA